MSAESLDILKNQSRRARRASNVKTIMLHVHSRIVSSMLPSQVILVAGIHKRWKPVISFVMYLKEAGDIHVCAACQRQIDLLLVERFYCSLTTFLASKWPQIWHDLSFVQLRDWIIGKLFNRFLMCCPFSVISFLFLASPLARCQQKISSTACLQRWLKNRLASTGTAWLMIPWVYCVASLVL